jgi:hypothetical protein
MRKKEEPIPAGGGSAEPFGNWFSLTAEVARLEAIVSIQQEVATSGASVPTLMALVTTRAQELTGATGGVIEMPDGEDLVYRVATGSASSQLGARISQHGTLDRNDRGGCDVGRGGSRRARVHVCRHGTVA